MGELATTYRRRKIAERSGAEHELDFYGPPPRGMGDRPCFCEWACLQRRLLGKPDPAYSFACACAGPIGIDVPGYPDDDERMRNFIQGQSLQRVKQLLAPVIQWYRKTIDLYMTTETDLNMDLIQAELIHRLAQIPPDDAEYLIEELA